MRAFRHRTRRLRAASLGTVAALTIAACTGGEDEVAPATTTVVTTTTTTVPRQDDGTLVIGVYLPVTGDGSELGQPMIAAVEQAVQAINDAGGVLGNDVLTIGADEGAGTGPGELLARGVDAIVGPASSLTALSQLAPAVDDNTGVVVCSPSATSLLLDDYPDNSLFFRTAPSDSMQMAAIARQVQLTGARSVAVGYLDDPYGRGLQEALRDEAEARGLDVAPPVGFSADQTDLSDSAQRLLAANPDVIVVLGDSDDGGRLLSALDAEPTQVPSVIVNDSIRQARQTIQSLSDDFRSRLTAIAPLARSSDDEPAEGFFTAHAIDCVNLIALSVLVADSDAPRTFRRNMAAVSSQGRRCTSFERCAELLEDDPDLLIDYDGPSGSAELGNTTGDPISARFQSFGFAADGTETEHSAFPVP